MTDGQCVASGGKEPEVISLTLADQPSSHRLAVQHLGSDRLSQVLNLDIPELRRTERLGVYR